MTTKQLEMEATKFLMANGAWDLFKKDTVEHIPLDSLINTPHDMMAVVEDELNGNTYFDYSVDAEQFLVSGKVQQIGGEKWYIQGTLSLEGRYLQRQDAWEKSIS